eukprot:TRINITY_DN10493_c0_g1_i1.p1 TRINITY_DN10493_c0_g1~~TRINITY_DN10493_c0_g1_i1.p1  ORF type:complete len:113 (-),score=16.76 TRINITY_DN10493_c0_g1_i1:34-348(-)
MQSYNYSHTHPTNHQSPYLHHEYNHNIQYDLLNRTYIHEKHNEMFQIPESDFNNRMGNRDVVKLPIPDHFGEYILDSPRLAPVASRKRKKALLPGFKELVSGLL